MDESSSDQKKKKQESLTSLGDLPGFGKPKVQQQDNDFDFGGFDDFNEEDSNQNVSKYTDAEKYLDDFDAEEREGFKVEVKRPNSKKAAPSSSGKKNKKNFSNKFGRTEAEDEDEIEEDIQTERDKEHVIESSLGHQAGITVS